MERGRRIAAGVAEGRTIQSVRCADDRIVFDGVAPRSLVKRLTGRRVLAVRRHGKQLWFELDEPPMPLFHFGMTGAFHVPGGEHLPLEAGIEPGSVWPPRFWKIEIVFDDGGRLAMTSARRLGRIRLRTDPVNETPVASLGFDPLLDMPSRGEFEALLASRRVTLKGLLLNQSFAAGVGNWIADEVLYQAGLDPRRRANSLSAEEVGRLRAKLRHVIRVACRVDADKARFPRSWLFHARWGRDTTATTQDGLAVEHLTVAGRTTAWVPSRQH